MITTREERPIRYPEDGHRMLEIVMDMTLEDEEFASHVAGGDMELVSRFIDRDESGAVVGEGFVIQVIFPERRSGSMTRNRWTVQQEHLVVSA